MLGRKTHKEFDPWEDNQKIVDNKPHQTAASRVRERFGKLFKRCQRTQRPPQPEAAPYVDEGPMFMGPHRIDSVYRFYVSDFNHRMEVLRSELEEMRKLGAHTYARHQAFHVFTGFRSQELMEELKTVKREFRACQAKCYGIGEYSFEEAQFYHDMQAQYYHRSQAQQRSFFQTYESSLQQYETDADQSPDFSHRQWYSPVQERRPQNVRFEAPESSPVEQEASRVGQGADEDWSEAVSKNYRDLRKDVMSKSMGNLDALRERIDFSDGPSRLRLLETLKQSSGDQFASPESPHNPMLMVNANPLYSKRVTSPGSDVASTHSLGGPYFQMQPFRSSNPSEKYQCNAHTGVSSLSLPFCTSNDGMRSELNTGMSCTSRKNSGTCPNSFIQAREETLPSVPSFSKYEKEMAKSQHAKFDEGRSEAGAGGEHSEQQMMEANVVEGGEVPFNILLSSWVSKASEDKPQHRLSSQEIERRLSGIEESEEDAGNWNESCENHEDSFSTSVDKIHMIDDDPIEEGQTSQVAAPYSAPDNEVKAQNVEAIEDTKVIPPPNNSDSQQKDCTEEGNEDEDTCGAHDIETQRSGEGAASGESLTLQPNVHTLSSQEGVAGQQQRSEGNDDLIPLSVSEEHTVANGNQGEEVFQDEEIIESLVNQQEESTPDAVDASQCEYTLQSCVSTSEREPSLPIQQDGIAVFKSPTYTSSDVVEGGDHTQDPHSLVEEKIETQVVEGDSEEPTQTQQSEEIGADVGDGDLTSPPQPETSCFPLDTTPNGEEEAPLPEIIEDLAPGCDGVTIKAEQAVLDGVREMPGGTTDTPENDQGAPEAQSGDPDSGGPETGICEETKPATEVVHAVAESSFCSFYESFAKGPELQTVHTAVGKFIQPTPAEKVPERASKSGSPESVSPDAQNTMPSNAGIPVEGWMEPILTGDNDDAGRKKQKKKKKPKKKKKAPQPDSSQNECHPATTPDAPQSSTGLTATIPHPEPCSSVNAPNQLLEWQRGSPSQSQGRAQASDCNQSSLQEGPAEEDVILDELLESIAISDDSIHHDGDASTSTVPQQRACHEEQSSVDGCLKAISSLRHGDGGFSGDSEFPSPAFSGRESPSGEDRLNFTQERYHRQGSSVQSEVSCLSWRREGRLEEPDVLTVSPEPECFEDTGNCDEGVGDGNGIMLKLPQNIPNFDEEHDLDVIKCPKGLAEWTGGRRLSDEVEIVDCVHSSVQGEE